MDYVEDKEILEKEFFNDIHHAIGVHRSKEENIAWLGDTVALEGTFTARELTQIAGVLETYKERYIALRNEID